MIAAVEKCSFLYFPGRLAAVAFTRGCNLRCRYCHNPELCGPKSAAPKSSEEFLSFLAGRRGLLSGVVMCGGEPTLWPEIEKLLAEIRSLGFAAKLDTNGTRPEQTESLLDQGLVDYLAVDVKAAPGEASRWLCGDKDQASTAIQTLAHAVANHVECEARTVLVGGVHDEAALSWIARQMAENGIARWRLTDVEAGHVLDATVPLQPPERGLVERALSSARAWGLKASWTTSRSRGPDPLANQGTSPGGKASTGAGTSRTTMPRAAK